MDERRYIREEEKRERREERGKPGQLTTENHRKLSLPFLLLSPPFTPPSLPPLRLFPPTFSLFLYLPLSSLPSVSSSSSSPLAFFPFFSHSLFFPPLTSFLPFLILTKLPSSLYPPSLPSSISFFLLRLPTRFPSSLFLSPYLIFPSLSFLHNFRFLILSYSHFPSITLSLTLSISADHISSPSLLLPQYSTLTYSPSYPALQAPSFPFLPPQESPFLPALTSRWTDQVA